MWLNKLEKRLKVAEALWGLEKLSSPSELCVEGGRRARKEEPFGTGDRPPTGPPADLSERDFLDYGKIVVETKMTITK
jgi:hypothetical protein